MYLKITRKKTKKGTREYAKIVEGYWDSESNFSRQKLILNLGPVNSKHDLDKYYDILLSMRQDNEFINIKDLKAKNAKEFGVTYITNKLFEKCKLNSILEDSLSANKAEFAVYGIIKALIVNRLLKPSSDLSALDWINKYYSENLQIGNQHIYRALDYLIKDKYQIEIALFQRLKEKLKLDLEKVHYDLTSSYFEGTCCSISFFGHSRDHRKDRKQIVIGLVMCDGIPIMHDVHEGNTSDSTTLNDMKENLKKKTGIKKVVVIADSGLMSKDNTDAMDEAKQGYILGCDRRKSNISKELLVKKIESKEDQYAEEIYKEKIKVNDKIITKRYILCVNTQTVKQRLETLENIKKKIKSKLKDLQSKYIKSRQSRKKKKMTRDGMMAEALRILGKNKRLFTIKFKKGLVYSLNKTNWNYEKKIAGKFLLVTNTDIEANEAMKSYKELQMVENAFDEIKNFLDVRPIYHRKKGRVKAHVFICVLALLIECLIEKFTSQSARKVINELETIKIVNFIFNGNQRSIITEISSKSKSIFKELKIQEPSNCRLLQEK